MKLKTINFDEVNQKKFFEISEVWLSTKDVARFLSTSENAVRIMVCRKLIPFYKFKNRLRFKKKDCENLIQKMESSHVY